MHFRKLVYWVCTLKAEGIAPAQRWLSLAALFARAAVFAASIETTLGGLRENLMFCWESLDFDMAYEGLHFGKVNVRIILCRHCLLRQNIGNFLGSPFV
jgi:hypothetical protein